MEEPTGRFKWSYNNRTGLGQKTFEDGQWEIVQGTAAKLIEDNRTVKGDIHFGLYQEIDEDAPGDAVEA